MSAADIDVVARTVWAEARNQGPVGMQAVANVIANRVKHPRWWGKGWAGVCQKRWQFSCWNPGDPNLELLLKVDRRSATFRLASLIAKRAIEGRLEDVTDRADHYFNPKVAKPNWAKGLKPVKVIRDHAFYRLEL